MFRALKRLACPEGAEEFIEAQGFNPGNHQIRRLAMKGRESTIRLIAPFVSSNLSVFRAPQFVLETVEGQSCLRARGLLVAGVARAGNYGTIKNRGRDNDDEDDWSIALS